MNTTLIILVLAFGAALGWILLSEKRNLNEGTPSSKDSQGQDSPQTQEAKSKLQRAISKTTKSGAGSPNQFLLLPEKVFGRGKEFSEIQQKLDSGTRAIGLYGTGGIGKTALASQVARAELSNFKDAQIYIDLKAGKSKSLSTTEVMARVIHSIHPREKLPKNKTGISIRYQSVLKNKRAILFFDNLEGPGRAKNLMPPKSSLLITTSKKKLSLPGMFSKGIEELDMEDANDLFQAIAPRSGFWAKEIVKFCGAMPLALVYAAKFLTFQTQIDPSNYSADLRNECNRLGSKSGLGLKEKLEAAFNMSYKNLPQPAARVLCKLTVFPGTFTKSPETFVCEDEDSEHLGSLVVLGLVIHNEINDRYWLHNETRKFLQNRLGGADQAKARMRHATYYLNIVVSANQSFSQGGDGVEIGLTEFDLEWDNIQAGFDWARENRSKDQDALRLCNAYTELGAEMLAMRQPPKECVRWLEAALDAAKQMMDSEAEKIHLLNLGREYNFLKERSKAIEYLEQAQSLARELDDKDSEWTAIRELGAACLAVEDSQRAISCFKRELTFLRSSDDRSGEQQLLENLGWAHRKEGQLKDSAKVYRESLELARKNEDKDHQGHILGELGQIYTNLKDQSQAVDYLEQGLSLANEREDKGLEENVLHMLGDAYIKFDDARKAITNFKKALRIAQSAGIKASEGTFLKKLGDAFAIAKDNEQAVNHYKKAVSVLKQTGPSELEGEALWGMSRVWDRIGNKEQAVEHAGFALKLFESSGHPETEAIREQLEKWGDGKGTPNTTGVE